MGKHKFFIPLICFGFILSACEQNIDTVPSEAEVVLKQSPAIAGVRVMDNTSNANSGISIRLYCGPSKVNSVPPLVIMVENGIETVLDGNLSDVDLQSISRYAVVKGKDAVGKYAKHTDIIKHYDGFIKLYKK